MHEPNEPLMSKRELAAYLKVHEKTVSNHVARGLPAVRVGGVLRFRLGEVLDWYRRNDADAATCREG